MHVVLRSLLVACSAHCRTRVWLQREILTLRHPLGILLRIKRRRIHLKATDRLLWVAVLGENVTCSFGK